MGALQNMLNNLEGKWKSLSSGKRIGIIVFASGLITALVLFITIMSKPKYEPLFYNMAPEDMAKVADELKQEKVSYKLNGDSILVPKEKVEELRLNVISAGVLPSDGKGFELFDQSSFGRTDTETNIMYQRALETELQRTIKGLFDGIDNVRVHLVLPEPSVFIRNEEPARASVVLKMKTSQTLTLEQTKSLIAIISGAVSDLPKENVEIVDNHYNYLSEAVNNPDMASSSSITDRQKIEMQFETTIADNLKKMLEAVYGSGKVKVSVNADLDFDSKQTTSIKYTDAVLKSESSIDESSNQTPDTSSASPTDNNTGNTIPVSGGSTTTTRTQTQKDYDVGQTEEKIITAPGEVKKLSTSVIVDKTLADAEKATLENIVKAAIGFVNDNKRQDVVTVEGIQFDQTLKNLVDQDMKELQALQKAEDRRQKLVMYIGYPAVAVVGLILLLILISRIRSAVDAPKAAGGIDMVINEPVPVNEIIKQQAMLDAEEDRAPDLQEEIRKYANKKPEQIVEIVKSWLAEDER